jgi:hypothetical protein
MWPGAKPGIRTKVRNSVAGTCGVRKLTSLVGGWLPLHECVVSVESSALRVIPEPEIASSIRPRFRSEPSACQTKSIDTIRDSMKSAIDSEVPWGTPPVRPKAVGSRNGRVAKGWRGRRPGKDTPQFVFVQPISNERSRALSPPPSNIPVRKSKLPRQLQHQ